MRKIFAVMFAAAFVLCSGASYADTVSGFFTTDNHYQMWISTNDLIQGSQQANSDMGGTDWTSPESLSFNLTPGVTNYLHVKAWDDGSTAAGVLGSFSLSSSNYWFDNGTQSLFTSTAAQDNLRVRITDWNGADITSYLVDEGGIGAEPWNSALAHDFSSIDSNARWVWTNYVSPSSPYDLGATRYFSVKINTVPEPVSTILFITGGAVLAVRRLRRKR